MLFDLRSRGRRRTVQVVYVGLAVLIGAGLILFGVGTGGGGGGLFGGLIGSSSSNNAADSAVSAATKTALIATRKHPGSASAWASLVSARRTAANQSGYDSATNTYTAAGQQQLTYATRAYEKYLTLTKTPSADTAILAAQAYTQLGRYQSASTAFQDVLAREPANVNSLQCLTITASLAKNTRLAGLAEARTLAKIPKSGRKQYQAELKQAESSPTDAKQDC